MKINVFAILKNFYDESFELNNAQILSVSDLKNELIKINPSAASLLNSCRFAVNEEFVSEDFQIKVNEQIYILPPSSGG